MTSSMTEKTQNSVADDILSIIEERAQQRNIDPGYLLSLVYERGHEKWENTRDSSKPSVPVDHACALIYNINWSMNQYQLLREYLSKFDFQLPTRNVISDYKKLLMPTGIVSTDLKAYAPLKSIVRNTLSGFLTDELLKEKKIAPTDIKNIEVKSKFGLDGSGCHNIRHQVSELNLMKLTLCKEEEIISVRFGVPCKYTSMVNLTGLMRFQILFCIVVLCVW